MSLSIRIGSAWLVGIGLLIACVSIYGFVSSRWACGESGYSFACDISNIAVFIGFGVAGLLFIVGAGVWRGRRWGLIAGIVIASLAMVACLVLMDTEPWLLWLPLTAANLAVALALAHALFSGPGTRTM